MSADIGKQLKIKVGALRRNLNDLAYCHKEIEREQARLSGEPDDDKKLQLAKVVAECERMLPLNIKRDENTASDLEEFLAANADELPPAVEGKPHADVAEAAELLKQAAAL